MLKLHVLASGSRGNASIVEDGDSGRAILIDCGISKRDFLARCAEAHVDPTRIEAVLVTHEHTDHTKGLGVVLRGLAKMGAHPDVFANPATLEASRQLQEIEDTHRIVPFRPFDAPRVNGSAPDDPKEDSSRPMAPAAAADLDLAGMRVFPFSTSHDAAASFGFRIERGGDAIGFMTDTGIVTEAAHDALRDVRILALECNHDPRMLEQGSYPMAVKRRIASDLGHLSNPQASEELASLLSDRLEQVVAMHISENNNDYGLALKTFSDALARECHSARVSCGYQGRLTSVR